MEVIASADQPLQPGPSYGNHPIPNAMDASMDIDMDLDLGPMPENEPNQAVSLLRSRSRLLQSPNAQFGLSRIPWP